MSSDEDVAKQILLAVGIISDDAGNMPGNCPDYLILEKSGIEKLPVYPAGFWFIRLLVIAFRDYQGKIWLPMQYHAYGSIWTTPHIAYEFAAPKGKRHRFVQMIYQYYDEWLSNSGKLLNELEAHQYYQMGMYNNESRQYAEYTEYKLSSAFKDRYQCYRLQKYHITSVYPDE